MCGHHMNPLSIPFVIITPSSFFPELHPHIHLVYLKEQGGPQQWSEGQQHTTPHTEAANGPHSAHGSPNELSLLREHHGGIFRFPTNESKYQAEPLTVNQARAPLDCHSVWSLEGTLFNLSSRLSKQNFQKKVSKFGFCPALTFKRNF